MNREIQQHITDIYSALDEFDNTRDLLEIRYWLWHLTRLSESVDDLEIRVNRCKQLVLVEKEKDPKFVRAYDKYHKKLER
jgi:hypothetical protein